MGQINSRTVKCPTCNSPVIVPCRDENGVYCASHEERLIAARVAFGTVERVAWSILVALQGGARLTYGDVFGAVDNDLFGGDLGAEGDDILEDAFDYLCTNGVVGHVDGEGFFRRYFMN